MKKLLLLTAGMIFSAGMAAASVTADQLVAAYQAQGYTTIDVTTGVSQIKVEAVLNQIQLEVVYDIATGAILNQEQSAAGANDANQGVEMAVSDQDFLSTDGRSKLSGKHGALALAGDTEGSDSTEDVGGDDNGSDGTASGSAGEHSGSEDSVSEDSGRGDHGGSSESNSEGG